MTSHQAIIFDMDGVLADTEPLHAEATRRLMAAYGVTYTPGHDDNFFGLTDDEVFDQLRRRYQLDADSRSLSAAWVAEVVSGLAVGLEPLPGVPAVLGTLRTRGYRLALASGSSPAIISATLNALDLAGWFEPVVSGKEVGRGKPAPDVFLETARRLGLDPAACLVVEDSGNGLAGAAAAGMACVIIPCGTTSNQDFARATARLASLEELPAWLSRGRCDEPGLRTARSSW